MSYHTLSFHVNAGLTMDQAGIFNAAFEEDALSAACKKEGDTWHFLLTFDHAPNAGYLEETVARAAAAAEIERTSIGAFTVEELEDRDWLAESYNALPPFSVGPFFIYGSHYEGTVPEGSLPLLIEAATAFGSGMHGTTSRCLLALVHLKDKGFKPRNILDMGCGSGILAIGAAKLWPDVPVAAADNDPECVRVTQRHMATNETNDIYAYVSEGYEAQSPVWQAAPYDLIVANILAAPLIEMAAEQVRAMANGGYIILSGTLREQGAAVTAAYEAHACKKVAEFPGDEWMTLLMQKA